MGYLPHSILDAMRGPIGRRPASIKIDPNTKHAVIIACCLPQIIDELLRDISTTRPPIVATIPSRKNDPAVVSCQGDIEDLMALASLLL